MNSLFLLLNSRALRRRLVSLSAIAVLIHVVPAIRAQAAAATGGADTNHVFPIDLPTTLRLANAQNLDIQIARERLNEARANHESAVEQFLPWIAPGAVYRRHEDRIQAVDGTILDVDKQSYTVGGALTAQMDLGEAIYRSLTAQKIVHPADTGLESQRQALGEDP